MHDGAIKFIKYAYPPNKLRYCGPSNSRSIFDYFQAGKIDRGLIDLLAKFNGAYPNLCYIARANKIEDPFDKRVVEAYWIGNCLLDQVSIGNYYQYLRDQYRGQWDNHALDLIFGTSAAYGAKPHHSFHVLSLLAKKKKSSRILEHIGNCLIVPGRINSISLDGFTVVYKPIVFKNNKLAFGKLTNKKLNCFSVEKFEIGDQVSFHWNWICDKITDTQIKNLIMWNKFHLSLVNKII
jgi:hypothetical protein